MTLEDLRRGDQVTGIDLGGPVAIVTFELLGSEALIVYIGSGQGCLGERMLFRADEAGLALATVGWDWDRPRCWRGRRTRIRRLAGPRARTQPRPPPPGLLALQPVRTQGLGEVRPRLQRTVNGLARHRDSQP